VSVVLFNHASYTVSPDHARAAEVQDIGHYQPGGGTCFEAAFSACHRAIGRSPPYAKELILFLTDGAAPVPVQAVRALLAGHGNRIMGLTCVAFGHGADTSTLQQVGQLFRDAQVQVALTTPGDEASLVQTFVEAAANRAIHIGRGSPS